MDKTAISHRGKILILATETCAYPGADSVGQSHSSYPSNTFILRVRAPVLFPEQFYMDCFRKGISGIIIMSCGEECPYEGAYKALAKRIDRVYQLMKAADLDIRRLRLTAICTVCNRAFLKEINQMNELIDEIGLPLFSPSSLTTNNAATVTSLSTTVTPVLATVIATNEEAKS